MQINLLFQLSRVQNMGVLNGIVTVAVIHVDMMEVPNDSCVTPFATHSYNIMTY
jgi:hypothetical protein